MLNPLQSQAMITPNKMALPTLRMKTWGFIKCWNKKFFYHITKSKSEQSQPRNNIKTKG